MAHICCGYIQNGGYLRSTNASYAATRSGSSLTLNTAATRIGQAVASGNYYAYEYFCSIDTSEMPEEAIVRSVRLFLYGSADSSDDDFTGEARAYDWGESVTTDDWVPGANLGDCALIASWSSASYSAAYNPFDGDGASINAGGVTKMVLASAKLRTGTAPTKYEFVDFTVPTSGTNLGMFIVLYDMPEPEQKPWFDVALEMTDIGRNCLSSEEVWGSTMLPLDPSDYDGSPQFYLELIANSDAASSGSIPRRMTLRDVTNGVDVASVVVPPSDLAGDNGRVLRSAPFTPNVGNNIYALKNEAGAVSGSWRAPSVRIIVRQTKPTKTRIQFPLTSGVDVASTDGGYVWQCSASYAQDSATRAVLWRKDSAALRSLASGTPWTLEAVFYSGWDDLVGHLVLRNLSSGNNVAASEVSAEAGVAGGSFILSRDFADDAAEFSDGALFGVFTKYSVRTDLRLQRAALYARLVEHLFPDRVPKLKLHRVKLDWARPLVPRSGRPTHIVWHHAAAKRCSVRTIHGWHLANGWSGFAYMFEVRKNGKVYVGRPENMLGGHTADWPGTIGIVFEGNFDVERMSDKQLRAGQALHRYLHRKYGCPDRGHRDMPGNSTGCPGRYFPLAEITKVK